MLLATFHPLSTVVLFPPHSNYSVVSIAVPGFLCPSITAYTSRAVVPFAFWNRLGVTKFRDPDQQVDHTEVKWLKMANCWIVARGNFPVLLSWWVSSRLDDRKSPQRKRFLHTAAAIGTQTNCFMKLVFQGTKVAEMACCPALFWFLL